jgi:hypothetical protein
MEGAADSHMCQLLPAYDMHGRLIMPIDYEAQLVGSTVNVEFSINAYPTGFEDQVEFVADIERVRRFHSY